MLREQIRLTRQVFDDIGARCERILLSIETEAVAVLTRMGAEPRRIHWLEALTTRKLDTLERHEALLIRRLKLLLERLM